MRIRPFPAVLILLTALAHELPKACAQKNGETRSVEDLTAALKSDAPSVQLRAAEALGELGPKAKSAVPSLIEVMALDRFTDMGESVGAAACAALGRIGPGAVPDLIAALGHENSQVRRGAALALHDIGPEAKAAVPELIAVMRENDPATYRPAIYALAAIGPEAKPAIPLLIDALSHENPKSRWEACRALGAIGPEAKQAVPELIALLRGGVASSRVNAAAALGKIGPAIGEQGLAQLVATLEDPQAAVREEAAIALGRLGPAAESAVPALQQSMQRFNRTARVAVLMSLWRITGNTEETVKTLSRTLGSIEAGIAAAEALGEMGPAAKGAVPKLVESLESDDPEMREAAARALGQIGPEANAAGPALEKLRDDADEHVREAAQQALQGIASEPSR